MSPILKPIYALRKLPAILLVAYVAAYYLYPSAFSVPDKSNAVHIAIVDAGLEFAEDFETENESLKELEGISTLIYHTGLINAPSYSYFSLYADAKPAQHTADLFCRYCSFIFYG